MRKVSKYCVRGLWESGLSFEMFEKQRRYDQEIVVLVMMDFLTKKMQNTFLSCAAVRNPISAHTFW